MAAHRYWRLLIDEVQSAGYVAIPELVFYSTVDSTTNELLSGTLSVSSIFTNNAIYNAAKAVDSNSSTFWHSGTGALNGTDEWIKVDFGVGVEKDIVKFGFTGRSGFTSSQSPKKFNLQYSDDNSSWTSLISKAGISGSTSFQYFTKDPISSQQQAAFSFLI